MESVAWGLLLSAAEFSRVGRHVGHLTRKGARFEEPAELRTVTVRHRSAVNDADLASACDRGSGAASRGSKAFPFAAYNRC